MKPTGRWIVLVLIIAGLLLPACGQGPGEATGAADSEPAKVEHLDGAQPTRITLTAKAAERLDIHTGTVGEVKVKGAKQEVIPYAAILYDTQGGTWVYTNPEPLVFVRWSITVDHIEGDEAILTAGPPLGTAVVTIGAAELYGSETEFEEE